MKSIISADSGVELRIANSLFTDKAYEFLPSFREQLDRLFKVKPFSVNFLHKPEDAREEINRWVEEKTEDLIKNLIPQGAVTSLTRGVLVNAIYFNGKWFNKFKKEDSQKLDFHRFDGAISSTPFLRSTFDTGYYENEMFQALQLPYTDTRYSMIFVLPKDKTKYSFLKLEDAFDETMLLNIVKGSGSEKVEISIPKFKSEFGVPLKGSLVNLGLKTPFDSDTADFSRMSNEKGLHISEVFHKAFIEVEEEGTKAAAATGVVMAARGMARVPTEIKKFKADHPFLYLIRDSQTGVVLFMGRLSSVS